MENASKALIMAGSVLISLIIIGVAVLAYNRYVEVEQIKQDAQREAQSVDFNKAYDAFNRKNVYGSELLSLANKIVDYNKLQASDKGYSKITLEVKIKKATGSYFKAKTYTDVDNGDKTRGLIYQNTQLEVKINEVGSKLYSGKSVTYYARTTKNEIAQIFGIKYNADISYDLADQLKTNAKTKNLMQDIETYNSLTSEQTEMKRKTFDCKNIQYDKNTGRVSKMVFEEN